MRRISRRGTTYAELLCVAFLLSIAATGAIATWGLTSRIGRERRLLETSVYIAGSVLEQVKDEKYLNLPSDTATNSPNLLYFDKNGSPVTSASTNGYTAKWWVTTLVNRNGVVDVEDLREIQVQVWDNTLTYQYETARTMVAMGGI